VIPETTTRASAAAAAAPSSDAADGGAVQLRCPRCKGELARQADALRCTGCSATYSIEDGIADLRCERRDYYFNPVPRPEMNQLIADAEHEPWSRTVRRFLHHVKDNPDWLDDLVVDARYAWKLFLDLPAGARVLELGCGLGNLAHNLAPHVGEVVAFDLTWERLRFAKRRFARFNAGDRITLVAGGDGTFLPFPDAHFDCVTLSGVLEWVADTIDWTTAGGSKAERLRRMLGSIFGDTNPRRMQLRFLQEIRRVLKPGGQLFVAIENRLDYEYVGRRPDHHSGLWYGSLLPRGLANLYSIARNRAPYRTYTYSDMGLAKLFGEAGFPQHSLLGFLDGYTQLNEVLSFGPHDLDIVPPPTHAGGVDRFRRHRHFVPAYGIMASPARAGGSSLLRRIVGAATESGAFKGPVRFERLLVSGKEKAVFLGQAGTQPVVMTVACNAAAAAAQDRHHRFLESATGFPTLAPLVPAALGRGAVQNAPFTVEARRAGQPLAACINSGNRTAWLPEVQRVLAALATAAPREAAAPLEGADFERLCTAPLTRLLDVLDDPAFATRAHAALADRVRGLTLRLGLMHGDFSVANLLVEGQRVGALIDWEDVQSRGLPILDAFNYLDSAHRACTGAELADTVPLLAGGAWPMPAEREWLAQVLTAEGLGREALPALATLYWIWHVEPQLPFRLAVDRPQIARRIRRVAEALMA
jgi:SAM-dependent methyltransferase/aminoglycoside phosphotransferase (APT) family kinase protein